MALLHILSEEQLPEEGADRYFSDLYRIVCVAEKSALAESESSLVRTTYVVDWEQLVHLLEEYTEFGEDIVEVTPVKSDEATMLRSAATGPTVARA